VGVESLLTTAAGRLVDAVARSHEGPAGALRAWALFLAVFLGYSLMRNVELRFWNPFAARNMENLITDSFERVQSFSADWHADTFAGATVRRVGRAMWGYDTVSDQLVLWLGPSTLVLFGLAISMLAHWRQSRAWICVPGITGHQRGNRIQGQRSWSNSSRA